jgi:hypothetical protein
MITIQLNEQDYLDAQRLHRRSSEVRFWVALAVAVLAFASVLIGDLKPPLPEGFFSSHAGPLAIMLAVGILLVVFRYVYIPSRHRRIFRQQKNLHVLYELSWSDTGFVATSERGSVRTAWTDVVKCRENEKLLLLYLSDVMFHILPKRSFPDDATSAQIREFVEHSLRVSHQ